MASLMLMATAAASGTSGRIPWQDDAGRQGICISEESCAEMVFCVCDALQLALGLMHKAFLGDKSGMHLAGSAGSG